MSLSPCPPKDRPEPAGPSLDAREVCNARASAPLMLRQQLPKVSGLPPFFTPGILIMGKLFLGIDPWAVRPEDARRLCKKGIPLLIIHSTDDETVSFEHATRPRPPAEPSLLLALGKLCLSTTVSRLAYALLVPSDGTPHCARRPAHPFVAPSSGPSPGPPG